MTVQAYSHPSPRYNLPMCGRFVSPEEATIERYWHLGRHNFKLLPRRFNVFPTDTVQFLRRPSNSEGLELGRWGLVPHWWKEAKPPKMSFNARVEEAAGKPMWRDAWSRARCLIPAEGWYEWQAVERVDPATGEIKRAKQPHFIRHADGRGICFAGLMSYWKNPETGESACRRPHAARGIHALQGAVTRQQHRPQRPGTDRAPRHLAPQLRFLPPPYPESRNARAGKSDPSRS